MAEPMAGCGPSSDLAAGDVVLRFVDPERVDSIADLAGAALGIVRFELAQGGVPVLADVPQVSVALPGLGGPAPAEVWSSPLPVSQGHMGAIHYAADGHTLFGCLLVDEAAGRGLDDMAYSAYREILQALRESGYGHLARVWNYFYGINQAQDGLERYQRFSVGRFKAFAEHGYRFEGDVPAASAIGIPGEGSGLWIYFLARRLAVINLENPRQISAYRYPSQYGPRSPSFSRATLVSDLNGGSVLYISGTASIRGHASVHGGDLAGQLAETVTNLEALLEQPRLPCVKRLSDFGVHDHLKVYVRHAADGAEVKLALSGIVDPACPVTYLQGDICRPDLLLEIEGVVRYF